MQKTRLKHKIKVRVMSIALLILVMLLFLLMVDLGVRVFLPQYKQRYVYDDYYIHLPIPDSDTIEITPDSDGAGKAVITINEDGFRGKPLDKERKYRRIMVYGDSFIEGEYSQLEDTFSYQLQENINIRSDERYEVINAGVAGYGPDQVSLRIEDEIEEYSPDILIFSIFVGNDYGDLVRNKIYRIGENGELIKNDYYINSWLKTRRSVSIYFPSAVLYFKGIVKITELLRPKQEQADYSPSENINDCKEFIIDDDNEIKNVFSDRSDWDIPLDPTNYCSQYKIKLMEGILKKVNSITKNHNVKMMVLIIPSKELVDDKLFLESTLPKDFDRHYLTDLTSELAYDQSIEYLNLYPYFFEDNIDNSFYFFEDNHWNEEGQRFASEIAAERLIRLIKVNR